MLNLYNFQEAHLIRKGPIDSWGEAASVLDNPTKVLFMQKMQVINDQLGQQVLSRGFCYMNTMPLHSDVVRIVNPDAPNASPTVDLTFPASSIESPAATLGAMDLAKWYSSGVANWTENGSSADFGSTDVALLSKKLDNLIVTRVKFTTSIPVICQIYMSKVQNDFTPIREAIKTDLELYTVHQYDFPALESNWMLFYFSQLPAGRDEFTLSGVQLTCQTPKTFGNTDYRILTVETLQGFDNYGYKVYVA